ncbi:hypothetical protein [Bradyrhizobium sp. AS23.2]|uniref:hypothetical protein n=1 Tax=Bradyrhizobium sp. AS23.2 TaxID=1680155 RepID=UPI00093A24AF|nr:hypothetical protein [Bradyrhizobium sp. AS23.2]OKO85379.1 hypothetical protein AC630_06030 [Bradyrhizobium sp. AS23.2]
MSEKIMAKELDTIDLELLSEAAKSGTGYVVAALHFDEPGDLSRFLSLERLHELGYLTKVPSKTRLQEQYERVYSITKLGDASSRTCWMDGVRQRHWQFCVSDRFGKDQSK